MVNLAFLLALLGSPDFETRDQATKSLAALTTYRHPVILAGLRSPDAEVVTRCRLIQAAHRARIFKELGEDLPGYEMLAFNREQGTTDWTPHMERVIQANGWVYRDATRLYLHYLLDVGGTEDTLRGVVRHLRTQQASFSDYWQKRWKDHPYGEPDGPDGPPPPPAEMAPPPRPIGAR